MRRTRREVIEGTFVSAAAAAAVGSVSLPVARASAATRPPWSSVPTASFSEQESSRVRSLRSRPTGVWDLHCHLASPGDTPEERMARLIEVADRMGIERLFVHLGMYPIISNPSPDQIRQKNDDTLRAVSRFPGRAFGLVYLNPTHTEASLAEIDRCIARGPFLGVKLLVDRRCNGPELDPIARRVGELDAFLIQHTFVKVSGNSAGESTPMDLAQLAARHPRVSMVCIHSGGDWEQGIRAVRAHKNVSVEISGSDPTAGFVEMAVRDLGAERVIYGTDSPGRSVASQLGKVLGAAIPARAKEQILRENLRRLSAPIRHAKGIQA